MIGSLNIDVIEELPKTGDRHDYLVEISGPGDNIYRKSASITRTLVSVWGLNEDADRKSAIEDLILAVIKVIGTASEPPGEGFWFDTYNTEQTLNQTIRQVPNKPSSFIKGRTVRDEMVRYVGDKIIALLDDVQEKYEVRTGERFFQSLDHVFERSHAVNDMNTPPHDRANYIYRICILSVILDRLNFTEHDDQGRSLMGFSSWLREQYGEKLQKVLLNLYL